jgi:hypothetical protein
MAQENISAQLDDLLASRNFQAELFNRDGPADPETADIFKFDYVSSAGKNYGTMVIILGDEDEMQIFYGDNLGRTMEGNDKDEFFDFIDHLGKFANMRRWTHGVQDISRMKHTLRGIAAIKEGLFEGYYGTRKISYSGEPTEARLVIKHNRTLGENDARFRYVESLFIETADGERFRLPFKHLAGGRAMLEHVRQGGKPYDIRGSHINDMVMEISTLSRFNRASTGRVLEGVTAELVTEAQQYYKSLRENLKRLAHTRGYQSYFESWHPAEITLQEELVENIKSLFVEQTLDSRIEAALPVLARLQQGNRMKEADIFESWANRLTEGTWALPDTPEAQNRLQELMSKELIVGPDAINATEQLYDLVGDDVLFDRLSELAARDASANIWDDSEVQARLAELGIQTPAAGEPAPQNNQDQLTTVDETKICNHTMEGEMCPEHGLAECGMHETYDASMDPEYRRPEPRQIDPDDRDQDPVSYGSSPALQRSPEQQREFEKYMRYLDRDRKGVREVRNTDDPFNDMIEDYLDWLEQRDMFVRNTREEEKAALISDIKNGYVNPSEIEYAMSNDPNIKEGSNDDPMNRNAAITGSYYESKSDPLERLKTLASIKKS